MQEINYLDYKIYKYADDCYMIIDGGLSSSAFSNFSFHIEKVVFKDLRSAKRFINLIS